MTDREVLIPTTRIRYSKYVTFGNHEEGLPMGRLARKMNFLIEEAICKDLTQLVPPGQRSRIVNAALRKELEHIRRRRAVEKLIGSSSAGEKLSTLEIVEALNRDRSSH